MSDVNEVVDAIRKLRDKNLSVAQIAEMLSKTDLTHEDVLAIIEHTEQTIDRLAAED